MWFFVVLVVDGMKKKFLEYGVLKDWNSLMYFFKNMFLYYMDSNIVFINFMLLIWGEKLEVLIWGYIEGLVFCFKLVFNYIINLMLNIFLILCLLNFDLWLDVWYVCCVLFELCFIFIWLFFK